MSWCAAFGCNNERKNCKGKNISFYSLPKEENIRKQWITALNRTELPKNVYVCSEHFEESCFDPSVKLKYELPGCEKPLKTKLILGSVPTKFSHKSATAPRTSSLNREKKKEMRKAVEEAINESSSSNTESTFKDAFTQISVCEPKTATKGTNARCTKRCRQTQTIKARKTLSIHHCKHIDIQPVPKIDHSTNTVKLLIALSICTNVQIDIPPSLPEEVNSPVITPPLEEFCDQWLQYSKKRGHKCDPEYHPRNYSESANAVPHFNFNDSPSDRKYIKSTKLIIFVAWKKKVLSDSWTAYSRMIICQFVLCPLTDIHRSVS